MTIKGKRALLPQPPSWGRFAPKARRGGDGGMLWGPWFAQQIMGARRTLVRLVDRPLVHRHRRVVDRLGQGGVGVADARKVVGGALELHRQYALVHQLGDRSEEHTSELQSLMRITYAVFFLK